MTVNRTPAAVAVVPTVRSRALAEYDRTLFYGCRWAFTLVIDLALFLRSLRLSHSCLSISLKS